MINHFSKIVLASTFLFISCSINEEKKSTEVQSNNTPVKKESFDIKKNWNNPVLMNGSSFGNYFQSLYKLAKYDDMLRFTSKELIEKYGKAKLKKMYSKMDFAYEIKLKSTYPGPDSTFEMNYSGVQFATNKMIRLIVKTENDTAPFLDGMYQTILT